MMPEPARQLKRCCETRVYDAMLLHMKRTTLQLDPALYLELRRRAAGEGRTLTDVVERVLRDGLRTPGAVRRPRVNLPSYDLGPARLDAARPGRLTRPEAEE